MTQLKNEYDSLMNQIGASSSDSVTARLSALANRIESEYDLLTKALFQAGSEAGRALEFQKLTLARDMSLIAVKRRAKAAKGAELTPQESAKFQKLAQDLANKTAEVETLQKELAKLQAESATTKTAKTRKTKYSKMSKAQISADRSATITKIKALLDAGCYDA